MPGFHQIVTGPWNRTIQASFSSLQEGSWRTCKANAAGENNSFIFTVCVKSVPRYHFKLAHVVLQMAVKEVFETHF